MFRKLIPRALALCLAGAFPAVTQGATLTSAHCRFTFDESRLSRAAAAAALRVDPEALFITGDYPTSAELDARQRIANYTEPALLLQSLSDRFGFARVLAFLPDYGRARRTLASNVTGARRRGFRRPDAAAVRRVFEQPFGRSWTDLCRDWERQML